MHGATLFKNVTNSAGAFSVQNAAGGNLLNINTFYGTVGIGMTAPISSLATLSVLAQNTGMVGLRVNQTSSSNILEVQKSGANVLAIANNGSATFQNSADSTTAFQVQNLAAQTLFVADTTNQRIAIGPAAVPANGVLTVGTNTTAASGGMYFGTDTNLYRSAASTLKTDGTLNVVSGYQINGTAGASTTCSGGQMFQNQVVSGGLVTGGSCVSASGSTLQQAYAAGNSISTTDARNINFSLADTATDSNFVINVATGSTSKVSVQSNSVETLSIDKSGNVNTSGGVTAATFSGNGASITALNATNIATGTVADARLTTNVTLQGNTFNGASQLVQLTAGGLLPALSGANLTALNGTNIASGTVANARLTTNVTLQGNTFNGASQLVQLTAGGILPVLNGANLTALTGANVTGTVANATTAITTSGNAATATALAANPTDCTADTYATTIAASGNLTCASITDAALSSNVAIFNTTAPGSLTVASDYANSYGAALYLGDPNVDSSVWSIRNGSDYSSYDPYYGTNCTAGDGGLCFMLNGAPMASIASSGTFFSNTIYINGTIYSGGSPDMAEYIEAAADVEAADVVSADPNNTERAIKSSAAYDGTAIGVISDGSSSFIGNGGAKTPTAKPLVLAGRVPVHVTNEGGAIHRGDYLTTSSTPGYAMKAVHAGPTIGKALGEFDAETGTVRVLVNLSYYDPAPTTAGLQDAEFNNVQAQTGSFASLNISGTATINNLTVTGSATIATLTVTGSVHINGDITVGGHIITAGGQPTSKAQVAAGGSATVAVDGTDTTGTITITTGSAPTAGDLAKILFSKVYGAAPHIVLSPSNDKAAGLRFFKGTTTATDFMFNALDTPTANTVYTFDYFIAQ